MPSELPQQSVYGSLSSDHSVKVLLNYECQKQRTTTLEALQPGFGIDRAADLIHPSASVSYHIDESCDVTALWGTSAVFGVAAYAVILSSAGSSTIETKSIQR